MGVRTCISALGEIRKGRIFEKKVLRRIYGVKKSKKVLKLQVNVFRRP